MTRKGGKGKKGRIRLDDSAVSITAHGDASTTLHRESRFLSGEKTKGEERAEEEKIHRREGRRGGRIPGFGLNSSTSPASSLPIHERNGRDER